MDTPSLSRPGSLILCNWKNRRQCRANGGVRFRSRGATTRQWGGALKGRGETWFIWNCDSRLRSLCPSPIDGQREETHWKRMEANYYQPADIRRVNDDKRKQAGKHQESN